MPAIRHDIEDLGGTVGDLLTDARDRIAVLEAGGGAGGGTGALVDARDYDFHLPGMTGGERAEALQNAVDAAVGLGTNVSVPAGLWDLGRQGTVASDPLVKMAVDLKGVELWGDGKLRTILRQEAGDYFDGGDYYMVFARHNGSGLRDISLNGNRYRLTNADEQTHLIRATGAIDLNFHRVGLVDAWGDGLKGLGELVTQAAASKVFQVDDSASTFTDITTQFNDATVANVSPFPATEAVGDYCAIGFTAPFNRLEFNYAGGTAGVGGAAVLDYWDGDEWAPLSGVGDNTGDLSAMFTRSAADGRAVQWITPLDWAARTLAGSASLYWIRIRVTATYSVNPVLDRGYVASTADCSASVTQCDFIGCRRGGLTVQRCTSRWIVLANYFRDCRGQALDYEPSGSVAGEQPLHSIFSANIFDNSRATAASDNDNVVALTGIATAGLRDIRLLFSQNQILNGALWMSRMADAVIAQNYVQGSDGFVPLFMNGSIERTQLISNVVVATGAAEAAIKAESSDPDNCCVDVDWDRNTLISETKAIMVQGTKRCSLRRSRFVRTGAESSTVAVDVRGTHNACNELDIEQNTYTGVWNTGIILNNNPHPFAGVRISGERFGDTNPARRIVEENAVTGDIPILGPNVEVGGVVLVAGQFYRQGAVYYGSGDPEGELAAPIGSQYVDTDNGTPYKKVTGSGDTGWAAV